MLKCDFCDEQAVGYTNYQIHVYCEEHEEIAIKETCEMLDMAEKARQEADNEKLQP